MSSPAAGTIPQSDSLSNGMSRGQITWMTAAALGVLYWIYSLAVSPLVVPAGVDSPGPIADSLPPLEAPVQNIELAKQYLPHAEWAANARHHYRTENSIVFAETWDRLDEENAVTFKPFAMVWMQKGWKPGDQPITIVAESAYVRFENKFEISNPNPGRVIGGSLRGVVTMGGPNDMKVVGKNFVFSEKSMRIWSDSPVDFEYGPHRGKAVGMQCDLLKAVVNKNPDSLAVGGIQSIRLQKNVAMNLVFEPGKKSDLFSSSDRKSQIRRVEVKPDNKKKPTLVRIRSAGSFEFGVQSNIATFEDDVKVFRPTKPGKFDLLMCGVLTLVFEPEKPTAGKVPAKKATDSSDRFKGMNGKLAFRRLRAQPGKAKRHVVLISEVNNLTAYMDDLIYDAESKIAELRDREAVLVKQDSSETRSPKITLQQDKRGKVTSLWCNGAGSIQHLDKKTGKTDLIATWKRRLRKFPDPKSNLDIVDLEEDAVLQQPADKTDLKAQFIRIWMDRREEKDKSQSDNTQPASEDAEKNRVKLRRMLALNKVTLTSPDMHFHTQRLETWFESAADIDGGSPHPRSRQQLVPAIRRTMSQRNQRTAFFRGQAFAAVGDSTAEKKSPFGRKKDDGPLEVWADLVRVLIVQDDDRPVGFAAAAADDKSRRKSQAREIWMLGNVRVQQLHAAGESPLRITGEKTHVVNRAENDQVLHIYGKPAKIYDRQMHIEGEQVHLDRNRNKSWVDGKGLLRLPVDRSLDGKKLDKPQTLDIWWKKEMEFDGAVAKFRGQVRSVIEGSDSRIRCEELDVFLSKKVSFGERNKDQKPEVDRLECRDNVEFESYEYEETKLIQIRKGRVNSFTLFHQTGKTEAVGPGWITLWRRGQGKSSRLFPAKVQANQSADKKKHEWDYTRIDFADTAIGNFREGYNRFKNHVQVVYGPVDRPPHVIDPDRLPEEAGWMRCKELVATHVKKTKTDRGYMTLVADGNAEVDGRGFHGRADHITYDESRDLYILYSDGRENAIIWRQGPRGRQRSVARRMEFNPSQNRLEFDQTRSLDGVR